MTDVDESTVSVPSRTIRLFVSSTFTDLKAERNALHECVFGKLAELCRKRGWNFQPIDLRWGVTPDASLDQRTMQICMAEIERCMAVTPRPNFLILIGDRYGWRPLPWAIPAHEFEKILQVVSPQERDLLLWTPLPSARSSGWYRLDSNAADLGCASSGPQGTYLLQARTGPFVDHTTWQNEVEIPLGNILRAAARHLWPDPDDPRRIKYEASATEQEIQAGALSVPDADEHVVALYRTIEDIDGRTVDDVTSPTPDMREFVDLADDLTVDREAQRRLQRLKARVSEHLNGKRVREYRVKWCGEATSTKHLAKYCQDALSLLSELVQAQMDLHDGADPLAEEKQRHLEFARERSRDFTGRSVELLAIDRYLETSGRQMPLIITGPSGSGKSALLSEAFVRTERSSTLDRRCNVLCRFIGATASSSSPRDLLEHLTRQLIAASGACALGIDLDFDSLADGLYGWMARASADRKLIIFLDALNQLAVSNPSQLRWIPQILPPNVRMVCSLAPGEALEALVKRLNASEFIELTPLDAEAAQSLLQTWMQRVNRRLSEHQWESVRPAAVKCAMPLYLRLLYEEVRTWRSYDPPVELPTTVRGMIFRMFDRVASAANHDDLLVNRVLTYLRCARHGLSEEEMLSILARDEVYWSRFLKTARHDLPRRNGTSVRALPVVIWSRLYNDLQPYLCWRLVYGASLMTFLHSDSFQDAVDQGFLSDSSSRNDRHSSLAGYFHDCLPGRRQTEELPWHLHKARNWEFLSRCLSDMGLFAGVWKASKDDARRYWASVEANSAIRITEAYAPQIHGTTVGEPIGLWGLASLLSDLGHPTEAANVWAKVATMHQTGGDVETFLAAIGNQAIVLKDLGRLTEAMALLEAQEKACRAIDSAYARYMLQNALGNKGLVHRRRGDVPAAIACHREKEKICRQIDHKRGLSVAIHNLAEILDDQGRSAESLAAFREEEVMAASLDDLEGVARSIGGQAAVLAGQGNTCEALTLYRKQHSICRELGLLHQLVVCSTREAALLRDLGDTEASKSLLLDAKQMCEQLGSEDALSYCLTEEAQLLYTASLIEEAEKVYEKAETLCRRLDSRDQLVVCLTSRAVIRFRQSRFHDALDMVTEAESICRRNCARARLAECLLTKAEALSLNKLDDMADEAVAEAEALGFELGLPRVQAHALNSRALRLLRQDRREPALELLRQAQSILDRFQTSRAFAGTLLNQALVYQDIQDGAISLALLERVQALSRESDDFLSLAKALLLQSTLLYRDPNRRNASRLLAEEAAALIRTHHGPAALAGYAENLLKRFPANADGFLDEVEALSGQRLLEHREDAPFAESLRNCACPWCNAVGQIQAPQIYFAIKSSGLFDVLLPAECSSCLWGVLVCFVGGKVVQVEQMGSIGELAEAQARAEIGYRSRN